MNHPGETMPITIRPAMEADQATITRLIRQAWLNPRHLHWANFLMAEVDGEIVGLCQIKLHRQRTRELASGLVLPEYRHQGVSARLMQEILAREKGPFYLMRVRQKAPDHDLAPPHVRSVSPASGTALTLDWGDRDPHHRCPGALVLSVDG